MNLIIIICKLFTEDKGRMRLVRALTKKIFVINMKYVGKAVKVGIVIKAIKVVANFCAIVCDISAFCVR